MRCSRSANTSTNDAPRRRPRTRQVVDHACDHHRPNARSRITRPRQITAGPCSDHDRRRRPRRHGPPKARRHEADVLRPDLIIVDPLVAYIGARVDIHRANETREVLSRLASIADQTPSAILTVRHLNKSSGGKAIYRGLGSIDFTAAVRSVLLVGQDPDDTASGAVVHIKSNLAPKGRASATASPPRTASPGPAHRLSPQTSSSAPAKDRAASTSSSWRTGRRLPSIHGDLRRRAGAGLCPPDAPKSPEETQRHRRTSWVRYGRALAVEPP